MDTSRVDGVKASLHDGTPRSHWDLVIIAASEKVHQSNDPRPQGNIARTYSSLGRHEDALRMSRDMYSGFVKLRGEEHEGSLGAACNYAVSLFKLESFDEAKSLMHKTIPVARRILGENNDLTLRMRWLYAMTLHRDDDATLDDVREAVETLEETERIARRVFGGAHPLVADFERTLRDARAALRARETLAEAMLATTLGDA